MHTELEATPRPTVRSKERKVKSKNRTGGEGGKDALPQGRGHRRHWRQAQACAGTRAGQGRAHGDQGCCTTCVPTPTGRAWPRSCSPGSLRIKASPNPPPPPPPPRSCPRALVRGTGPVWPHLSCLELVVSAGRPAPCIQARRTGAPGRAVSHGTQAPTSPGLFPAPSGEARPRLTKQAEMAHSVAGQGQGQRGQASCTLQGAA